MMVEIIKEYGNNIPAMINKINKKHIDSVDKENAEMIFSTVHRCKGIEYDAVQVVDDFISDEKLEKLVSDNKKEALNFDKINLLYVAITRAKNSLHIPETLKPAKLQASGQILILGVGKEVEKQTSTNRRSRVKEKIYTGGDENSFSVNEIRKKHRVAYKAWHGSLMMNWLKCILRGFL